MNRQTYDKIIEIMNSKSTVTGLRQDILNLINKELASSNLQVIKYETFASIYGNLKRRQMFKSTNTTINWKKLKENSINLAVKYKEYEKYEHINTNVLLLMSSELGIAPVLMARLILDGFIRTNSLDVNEDTVANKMSKDKSGVVSISCLIKESHILKNGRLASEILECCALDDDYGPSIDLIKNLIGLEYEIKLEKILEKNQISFIREDALREKGFDKTPDFKLDTPIYLNNGACISWIDSKATFGDEQSHTDYYDSQFKYYINRFGPGLVIYWFGYLSDIEKLKYNSSLTANSINLNSSSSNSNRLITISDTFPTDFTTLNVNSLLNNWTM